MSARMMTQADYARYRGVARKTITALKQADCLVLSGKLVDVAASDELIEQRGRLRNAPAPAPIIPPASEPPRPPGPICSILACYEGAVFDFAEAVFRLVPIDEARRLTAEFQAVQRRGAIEVADDDGEEDPRLAPIGFASWGEHPAFCREAVSERDWQDIAASAAASRT